MSLFQRLLSLKSYLVVLVFTMTSHLLGFGREVAIAYNFGTSSISDGLLAGLAPLVFYLSVFGTAYANAVMSRLKDVKDNDQLVADTFLPVLLCAIVAGMSFALFDKQIVGVFAPGLGGEGKLLAEQLVFWSAIGAGAVSISAWLKGLQHLRHKFSRVSAADLMPNIGALAGLIVFYQWFGVEGLAMSIIAGYLLQLMLSYRNDLVNFSLLSPARLRTDELKTIYKNTMWATFGYSVVYVDLFIDRYFASSLEEGSITILNFAYKVMSLPLYTAIIAVITVTYPKMIQAREDKERFGRMVKLVSLVIGGFAALVSVIMIVLDEFIISLLFEYGAFNASDVTATAELLQIFSMGLMGHAFVVYLVRLWFSLELFKVPVIGGVCAAIVNIVLDYMLVDSYGAKGLAAATTIAAYVNCSMMALVGYFLYQRKTKKDALADSERLAGH